MYFVFRSQFIGHQLADDKSGGRLSLFPLGQRLHSQWQSVTSQYQIICAWMTVNNLPIIVAWNCNSRQTNTQPHDCYYYATYHVYYVIFVSWVHYCVVVVSVLVFVCLSVCLSGSLLYSVYVTNIYTVNHKKRNIWFLTITLVSVNRFL